VEQLLSFQHKLENLIDLLKLLFIIGIVCHIFSLFWYELAVYEINYLKRADTWLHSKNLVDSPTYKKYIYSCYYIAVTMITVGYGDITP
jgi:hypothetical protein